MIKFDFDEWGFVKCPKCGNRMLQLNFHCLGCTNDNCNYVYDIREDKKSFSYRNEVKNEKRS